MSRHSSVSQTFLSIELSRSYSDDYGMYASTFLKVITYWGELTISNPRKFSWPAIRYAFTWQSFPQYREVDDEHIEADIAADKGKRIYTVWKDGDHFPRILLRTPRKREALRFIEDREDLRLHVQGTPLERWVADQTRD